MRVVVDLTKCQGYAQCAFLAPSSFQMQGDEALMYDPRPPTTSATVSTGPRPPAPCRRSRSTGWPVQDMPPVRHRGPPVRRIVIVGASLAGLRAAEALRERDSPAR